MESEDPNRLTDPVEEAPTPDGIAIVGMAGRFPGAADIYAFWRNLREGVESISVLSREELAASGVEPALLDDPRLIPAGGVLDGIETFDAAFFGFGPREAEAMDPQLRLFLEVAWEAFEHAGYDSESYSGTVGIFGGMGASNYLIRHLLAHPDVLASLGPLQARILTDKDFLVSLAAFKMNLTGPSINVQTACSTSMVATVLACQSLVTYQCDVALAGGSTILLPQAGYLPMEGVSSPDGKCRAFDARSHGTVGGSGAGVVVLKRLADALAEGDTVHAVIKGFATNNDGSFKMGYTAPGIEGQIQVVAMAQAVAGIRGDSITYVEAHGTGTPLGDPIEVDALTEVFRSATDRTGYCALGSVKSNVGHLDTAAGVASLIKTALALEHRQIPPSLGFEIPNPQIDFPSSPFFVNTRLRDWTTDGVPRRAGVSSFAIGGVNAHVVLEEAPPVPAGDPAGPWQLLVLSARTETALDAVTSRLIDHLEAHPEEHLATFADIAHTLQVGRRAFRHRRALVCRGREDAIAALKARDPRRLLGSTAESRDARPAFLFPGLGNHHVGMARDLYREEPRFREVFDECAGLLLPELGVDLRTILYPDGLSPLSRSAGEGPGVGGGDLRALLRRGATEESPAEAEAARRLRRTELAQPAVFAVEYALARLLMDMGLTPEAMLGFSVGEYVAACLAGVFELRDALRLVARRAKLISELPSGAMLAVPLSEAAAGRLAGTELSVAAVLGPELTVLAGPEPAVAAVEARLSGEGLQVRRLETEHAFHSRMMDPIAGRFRELFRGVRLQAPEIPFLSNVTGTWITPEQATDPGYWADHLRKAVRFADGVAELWREPGRALLEAGPGQTLTSWALQHPAAAAARDGVAVATMRHGLDRQDDQAFLLSSLARLWLAGVRMDWNAFRAGRRRLRVPLPTYPFERQRYWLEPGYPAMLSAAVVSEMGRASMDQMRPEAVADDARQHLPAGSFGMVPGARVRPELPVPYAEPRSEVERLVTLVWKDLLGVDRIGIWDGFFDLGGDSILATKLVTRLNEAFAAGFSLRSVFEKPTVADMAAVILARRAEGGGRVEEAGIPRIPRGTVNGESRPLPVSFSQRRLWFLDQLAPGDPFYNVPAAAELSGRVEPGVLARCFLELVRRHETLRTRLVNLDGEPFQVIEPPPASWTLPLVDLRALPAERRDTEGVRVVREEARLPFDLSRAPLLRTLLLRLEDRRYDLSVTLHHVVSDGWSNVVFLHELAELNQAFLEGRPSPLQELPIQYADFAAWQQEQFEKGVLAEQLAWWRGELAGLPPALDLPTDRPRPPVQTFGGLRILFVIEPEVAEGLRARARETGATLYMLFVAAMHVLLYRHANQTSFAVGSAIANRTRRETEKLIGFFTNTLVLRAEIDPEESFRGLLRRTRDTARQAFQHQDIPFEKLVEELQPKRDLSRSPFFQVMMVETLIERRMLDDLGLRSLEIDPGVARFDFLFDMSDQGREVTGILEYNSDLFDAATAERIVQRWRTLLAALSADADVRVGEVRMLPAEEWEVVAGPSIRPIGPIRPIRPINASPALVDLDGSEITYPELRARANQLAHWLRRQGVGPDVPVALSLPRSGELLVGLLGILEAGGAYVPLDPEYPAERRAFSLRDSGAPLLLTRAALAAELPRTGARVVDLGSLDLSGESTEGLPRLAGPESLAYLLYTSGSTGRPKGVAMVRGALDNLIAWQAAVLPGAWRTLQFTSFNFDVSYQEIFSTWAAGGTLVLVSEEDRRDPEALLRVLRERQVERLFLPFVALQQLAEAAVGADVPDSLREVITAGEQLRMTPALVDLFRRLPGARLHNQYGPTEAHVVTGFTLDGDPETWPALPPIGRPLPGTKAVVLDPHGGPAPLGVPGEVYLGGVCLARGYLGRPDLTAERFVPDPFAAEPGARLYRTGDRARLRAGGEIEYLGRVDDQVKIRGYRVEPGEVEAAIAAHPGVAEGVVGVRESADGSRRLVAWVVPRPGRQPDGLRAFLAERLPDHEVPSAIAFVDAFPLTPSGKVDRRRLLAQAPVPEVAETAPGHIEPRTPEEELVAGIWAEVLELPRVGVEDDFFALGGHSLLATRITARVRTVFGVSLPVRALFEASTVAGLAARIETEAAAARGRALVPVLTPEERTKILTEWVPAAAPLAGSPLLHERFAEQARRTPKAPALRDSAGGERRVRELSYRELDLRSDLLAAELGARGVRPGATVGVELGRSAEAVVAILGILKAGAAWLPLDPSLPAERRAAILEDSRPAALVSRVDLDALVPAVRAERPDLPGSALAYILYTSGSTGRPKGVCCTHAGAVNLVEEMQRQSPLPPGTVCSQWASLSFDASILEIFSAFFAGGCLDIVPESLRTDMPALAAWMAERGVGSVFLPPALLADFAAALGDAAAAGTKLPLRRLQVGGESVPVAPLAALAAQYPEAVLFDCYGPTEAAITATLWSLPAGPLPPASQRWSPIGRPFANVRAYVLGPTGEPVPAGVGGELFLAGLCLAHGYLGRPDLTAERFLPDPFGDRTDWTDPTDRTDHPTDRSYRSDRSGADQPRGGSRLYRTGDLARWTPDGLLEFLGRVDHQVKVRGFRIELGEVEGALLRCPGVVEAVALAPEREGGRRLEAFVVASEIEVGDLRRHLAGSLPGYMIPASIAVLPALPRTAGGKVDRRRLAEMAAEAVDAPAPDYVAPRTPQEKILADVWAEVLGVPRVGVHDDFFVLGGHSLLATRVVARVHKMFGLSLSVRSLFEASTLEQFAAQLGTAETPVPESMAPPPPSPPSPLDEKAVAAAARKPAAARPSPIPRVPRDRPLPLSFAQERIWFLEQLKPGTTAYHLPAALDLRGALDPRALVATLGEILRRHEALRTVFREEGGMPVQHILPPEVVSGVALPVIDLRALSAAAREAEADRLAAGWFQRPFDLRREPMLRAALLVFAPEVHRLFLLQHHIASDGWSYGVLLREVVTLYPRFAGVSGAGSAALPELPIQYADFAVWQRGELQGETLDRLVDAWRQRLAGAPPAADLPTDRPRPAAQEFHGENLTAFYGQRAAVSLLGGLARGERATLFMVLLAVFETLLQRWSGADDMVVGTPVAGRQRPELEGLIGVFINTLALRGRLGGEPTFRELVGRTRETAFDAYALQELPFETLVKKLHPVRDMSRPPVFQTMFVLQNAPLGRLELPGLVLEPRHADSGGAKLEMLLSLTEERGGLDGALEYNTTLFDRSTAERFLRHFGTLMESAAANPDLPASRLPLLSAEERAQLLGVWGDGGALARTEDLLHARFQELAAVQPAAAALTWNGRDLAYGELAARAWRLARHLRSLGVGPEVRVGVSLERSPDLVVSLLAVLAAGGAYVPIEPALPAERRAFLVRDTRMPVLITRRGLLGGLQADGVSILDPGEAAAVIAGYEATPLQPLTAPDNLAYLIYTSGSTGVPKGVAIPHRSAVAFLRWAESMWSREDLAAVLAATSVSFDLSVFELFAPLSVGGKAVLVENALRLRELMGGELMEGEGVTLVNTVPSAMAEVVRLGAVPPSVRVVNLAGEPLRRRLADELFALGVPRVLNLYGPSEDTTYSTWEEVRSGETGEPGIGRPIAGTRAYVLDRNLEPAPEGVPGELCLAGAGLARGYLGRPDLTAERFVPDPFSAKPAGRLYRTGDRARWKPDGTLEFLGRIDHQVKIRGFRIELGEIEAALLACPGIAEAAVLVREREDARGDRDRRLEAVLVAAPGEEPTLATIRADLARRLPDYMIPQSVVFLAALPHTATGKVDRRALAQIEAAAGGVRREYVPPRTEVETWLAETCAALLGVERVGLRDRFFDLGGHSLLATQLIARLRDEWLVDLPLQDVFAAADLGDLADRITDLGLGQVGDDDLAEALAELGVEPPAAPVEAPHREAPAGPPGPPIVSMPPIVPMPSTVSTPSIVSTRRPADAGFPFEPPLSFEQLRLWIIDRIEPGTPAYNVALTVRLEGELDPALLAGAFGVVARRHEAVRTTFATRGGEPVQIIHPPAPVPVPVLDLAALPEPARSREAVRRAAAEEMRPFDLEHGPVLRASLLRCAPTEHVLLLTLHHIVCDEWSIRLLFREVVTLYAVLRDGRPASAARLPALPVQYADYAVWQRGWLTGAVLESHLAFWRSRLADAPVLELPADRPRPPLQTFRGARISFTVPAETVEGLHALAHRHGATPFMTLLAAFQALLARTSGQTDLTVGTPITDRTRREVQNLIGFFLNTLVLRADLGGDPAFGEILDRTRTRALEAFAHQDLPFEKLVDEIGVRRSLSHPPLFQAMFVFLHIEHLPEEATGLRSSSFATDGATVSSKFDLTVGMRADGEALTGVIEYNRDLFDRTTVLRLAERFRVLCGAAADDPGRRLSGLPVLPEAEAFQVLHELNDRPPRHDLDVRLTDLVAAWAEREPERIAVEWEGGAWTYADLVGRARALAVRLRALGVAADVPVAVQAARGPALPIALLAIFESGGAYLPIDPAYPKERQAFILEDSGAKVLLALEETEVEVVPAGLEPSNLHPGGEGSAYVIYTSGSTGTPKGIAVPHRVLANLILWQLDPDRPDSMPGAWRTLQLSSPSFDVSLHEIFSTWCGGGTLVLPSDEDRRDPERLARRLDEAEIDRIFLPFVALQQLAGHLALPGARVPGRLRRVITAGEQLQVTPQIAEAFRRLSAATGGTALHNHYGPSETHVTTELVLSGDPARWSALPTIGRPIAGTTAYVLDRALQPVPLGVAGELVLGGVCPARGYLGRPGQTAESFIPDPWSGVPGARLYRSGDLARLLPDGTIEFLGRIDHQVKIRGYRIELGEIEAVLAAHPRVRECAVAVREDRPGDRRLVAWIVPRGGQDLPLAELRDGLRERLPEFMVPSAFVKLDALPLTTTGKVLRSALPAPDGERLAAAPYVEPRTAVEREIAAVFREQLGLGRVGREDNFFDLGGHSLTMVRAAAELSARLGRPVAVLDLFRTPTVASLARQLEGEEEALTPREELEERAEARRQSLDRRRQLRLAHKD